MSRLLKNIPERAIDWDRVPLHLEVHEIREWLAANMGARVVDRTIAKRRLAAGFANPKPRATDQTDATISVREESPGKWIAHWRWRGEQHRARGMTEAAARARAEERLERQRKEDT